MQGAQPMAPKMPLNVPRGHVVQTVAAVLLMKEPNGQDKQAVAAVVGLKVPLEHGRQTPPAPYVPLGQLVQVVLPLTSDVKPGAQRVHPTAPALLFT